MEARSRLRNAARVDRMAPSNFTSGSDRRRQDLQFFEMIRGVD